MKGTEEVINEIKWFFDNYPGSNYEIVDSLGKAIYESKYTLSEIYRICRRLKVSFNEYVPIDDHLNLIIKASKESYLELRKGISIRDAILVDLDNFGSKKQ